MLLCIVVFLFFLLMLFCLFVVVGVFELLDKLFQFDYVLIMCYVCVLGIGDFVGFMFNDCVM